MLKCLTEMAEPLISESYFEDRVQFTEPIFGKWTISNPLVEALFSSLRKWNVALKDFSWNKDPNTYQEIQLTLTVPEMNAIIRVGLDSATFIAVNPDWSRAPALVELFETAWGSITGTEMGTQELALAMHVMPGNRHFGDTMQKLVNAHVIGPATMYGISVYQEDSSLVIDKSQKYEGGLFLRLYRKLEPGIPFSDVGTIIYEDELRALRFIGLESLIQG